MTANSELAEQYLSAGDSLQKSGKLEEAIAQYQKLLAIQADSPIALNKIAEIYYTQQKYVEAIASCYQALRQQPNFAAAYKTLGNILQAQGKIDAAIRAYSKAIEFDPNFV